MATDDLSGLARVWAERPDIGDGPPGYLAMAEALRVLQDRVAAAAPPDELIADIRRAATDLAERLAPYAVVERDRISGRLHDVPGRGQTLVPAMYLDEPTGGHQRGTVTFGDVYLGGNGAVHGGVIPLMFDEVLGRLSTLDGRSPSRTAYLHVDYRSITPLGRELRIEAWFEKEEGRKRLMRGTLHDGDTLCVEVEGLFVALKPGQP